MSRIRDYSNSYYSAVMCAYVETLILKGADYLLDFIRNVVDFEHFFVPPPQVKYSFEREHRPFVVGYLGELH